jgi:hypothetical protein
LAGSTEGIKPESQVLYEEKKDEISGGSELLIIPSYTLHRRLGLRFKVSSY